MDFKIVIDGTFLELWADSALQPVSHKHVLSLLNDFEDGAWRLEKFKNFIWDNIADTALSYREREALRSQPASLLKSAARNLRLTDSENDFGKGSELAEVALYGIMKHVYGAIPVVPKIFYKQNTQDNAKGADSVHITVESNGDFSLWFGEAKFYCGIEDTRLDDIIQTVKSSLATDKLRKENSIVTSVSDLEYLNISASVKQAIRDALSHKTSIDDLKPKIHVPILLLHECSLTASATEWTPEYIETIKDFHKERALSYFSKQIRRLAELHKYSLIHFHLILFPVPKKQPIVDAFVKDVEFYRG